MYNNSWIQKQCLGTLQSYPCKIHVKCEYTTSSYACFIPPLQIKIFFTSLKKIPILEHAMLNVSLCKYLSIALDILASQNGLLSLHQWKNEC